MVKKSQSYAKAGAEGKRKSRKPKQSNPGDTQQRRAQRKHNEKNPLNLPTRNVSQNKNFGDPDADFRKDRFPLERGAIWAEERGRWSNVQSSPAPRRTIDTWDAPKDPIDLGSRTPLPYIPPAEFDELPRPRYLPACPSSPPIHPNTEPPASPLRPSDAEPPSSPPIPRNTEPTEPAATDFNSENTRESEKSRLMKKFKEELGKLHYFITNAPTFDANATADQVRARKHNIELVISELVETLYGFEPRPFQVTCLRYAVHKRIDFICRARTGSGKSIIFQAGPLLLPGSICLVVLPLNVIGQMQATKMDRLGLTRSIHITAETTHRNDWDAIETDLINGLYTHVYLSPEMAVSPKMERVMGHHDFKIRLFMVAIDELHLCTIWGLTFRPEYGQLHALRQLLLDNVVWFGCSATLNPKTIKLTSRTAGFRNPFIVDTPLDRPEILPIIAEIPDSTKTKMAALTCLLPKCPENNDWDSRPNGRNFNTADQEAFTKSTIFCATRHTTRNARYNFCLWLVKFCGWTWQEALRATAVYTSETAPHDKNRIIEEFSKPNSKIIWVFCTTAMMCGADIPDIRCVVVYGLDPNPTLEQYLQQIGRGARTKGIICTGIWFIDGWAYRKAENKPRPSAIDNLRPNTPAPSNLRQVQNADEVVEDNGDDEDNEYQSDVSTSSLNGRRKRKKAGEPRPSKDTKFAKLAEILQHVFTDPSELPDEGAKTCIRTLQAEFFGDRYPISEEAKAHGCCSHCTPGLRKQFTDRILKLPTVRGLSWTNDARIFADATRTSFDSLIKEIWPKSHMRHMKFEDIIPKEIMMLFFRKGFSLESEAELRDVLSSWQLLEPIAARLWTITAEVKQNYKELESRFQQEKADNKVAKAAAEATSQPCNKNQGKKTKRGSNTDKPGPNKRPNEDNANENGPPKRLQQRAPSDTVSGTPAATATAQTHPTTPPQPTRTNNHHLTSSHYGNQPLMTPVNSFMSRTHEYQSPYSYLASTPCNAPQTYYNYNDSSPMAYGNPQPLFTQQNHSSHPQNWIPPNRRLVTSEQSLHRPLPPVFSSTPPPQSFNRPQEHFQLAPIRNPLAERSSNLPDTYRPNYPPQHQR